MWDIRIRDDRFPNPGASIRSWHGLKRALLCHLRANMNIFGPGTGIIVISTLFQDRYLKVLLGYALRTCAEREEHFKRTQCAAQRSSVLCFHAWLRSFIPIATKSIMSETVATVVHEVHLEPTSDGGQFWLLSMCAVSRPKRR